MKCNHIKATYDETLFGSDAGLMSQLFLGLCNPDRIASVPKDTQNNCYEFKSTIRFSAFYNVMVRVRVT